MTESQSKLKSQTVVEPPQHITMAEIKEYCSLKAQLMHNDSFVLVPSRLQAMEEATPEIYNLWKRFNYLTGLILKEKWHVRTMLKQFSQQGIFDVQSK